MIAVLISKFSDLYFTAILEGIVWVAEERGYIISVFSTEEDRKKGSKCIETVYEYGMDGAILSFLLCRGKNSAAAQVLQCADGYTAQKLQGIRSDGDAGG